MEDDATKSTNGKEEIEKIVQLNDICEELLAIFEV